MARLTKVEDFRRRVASQRRWIEQCGGTLPGYIERYARHYKRGAAQAQEIYNADQAELRRLEQRLAELGRHTARARRSREVQA